MKNIALKLNMLALLFALNGLANAVEVTGAGSTFVYPVIAKWAETFKAETKINVNYQSIGSGGGIKQIQNKTVDFGATDMPLKSEDLKKDNLLQFPIINGGVVPVINLAGTNPGDVKLTGDLLANIYLGKITKWNDPAIASLNAGVKLPDSAITVVHRADGSGTSFIWTNYLSKVSSDWKSKVGEGTAVKWPAGVAGKGNEGVASYVQRIDGSIGYVEYAYALQNKMNYVQVKNSSGNFVKPSTETFEAAAAGADWSHFYLILTNAPGKNSWPIVGSTFILMQRPQLQSEQSKAALAFFKWALSKGQKLAHEINYVPFPPKVVSLIEKSWNTPKTGAALSR